MSELEVEMRLDEIDEYLNSIGDDLERLRILYSKYSCFEEEDCLWQYFILGLLIRINDLEGKKIAVAF